MQSAEIFRETERVPDNALRGQVSPARQPTERAATTGDSERTSAERKPARQSGSETPSRFEPRIESPSASESQPGKSADPGRKRVETVVETLAALRGRGETLAELAHDARNMVTALGLYCELLEEPGVLATPFTHYGHELALVAAASRRLVEKIAAIDAERATLAVAAMATDQPLQPLSPLALGARALNALPVDSLALDALPLDLFLSDPFPSGSRPSSSSPTRQPPAQAATATSGTGISSRRWDLLPPMPVVNLAAEVLANRNLLAALAGPAVILTIHAEGAARPVWLTGEDLTRVLVNLVKNATEAMPAGGRIHIGLEEQPPAPGAAACLLLTVEDSGPGIPAEALPSIFASGYTSHSPSHAPIERPSQGPTEAEPEGSHRNWTLTHRGLGLAITRSIVEGAGGCITAGNGHEGGARFSLELPLCTGVECP
jgi:signal transduction histidine kinase